MKLEIALLGTHRRELAYDGYARQHAKFELATIEGKFAIVNREYIAFPQNQGDGDVVAGGFLVRGETLNEIVGWLTDDLRIGKGMHLEFAPGALRLMVTRPPNEAPFDACARLGSALESILGEGGEADRDRVNGMMTRVMSPKEMVENAARELAENYIARIAAERAECAFCPRRHGVHHPMCPIAVYQFAREQERP